MLQQGRHLLNIDHHHDNTRFGTLDHVVPDASCTAEIVWDLMHGLGVRPTAEVARALYVGLITDTGRFMYENTGPRAHEMAAELIGAGVDVQDVYRRLYEEMPAAKIALLALALGRMRRFDAGELTLAALSAEDFLRAGAEDSYSEGIIDHLRAVQGTKVAALVRELSGERGPAQSVVARDRRRRRRVGDRARAGRRRTPSRRGLHHDAGGRAAGRVLAQRARRTAAPHAGAGVSPDGILLIDKPAGMTSHDVVAAVRRALGGVKVGHAGTLDPFATGLLIVLVGRATKAQRRLMELPKRYETVARLGATSSTGDTEGEIADTGRLPPDPPPLPTGEIRQRPPRHSAVKIGGERAYRRARRGEEFELPERIVTVYRFEQLWREDTRAGYAIECSAGTYVRSLIADLNDAYCVELRRTAIGPFEVTDAVAPPGRGESWAQPPLIALEDALQASRTRPK